MVNEYKHQYIITIVNVCKPKRKNSVDIYQTSMYYLYRGSICRGAIHSNSIYKQNCEEISIWIIKSEEFTSL